MRFLSCPLLFYFSSELLSLYPCQFRLHRSLVCRKLLKCKLDNWRLQENRTSPEVPCLSYLREEITAPCTVVQRNISRTIHRGPGEYTHRSNMIMVPLWITEVQQGKHRNEKIQPKLEDFKIWTTHLCRGEETVGLLVVTQSKKPLIEGFLQRDISITRCPPLTKTNDSFISSIDFIFTLEDIDCQ